MTGFEWTSVMLSVLALLVLPALALTVRQAVRWARTEDKLTGLVEDVKQLAEDSREGRIAVDRRLRWLEENLWQRRR